MSESTEHLVDWLRDAHAMEEQGEQLLNGEIKRLKSYPELERKLQQQLGYNQRHQELLTARIEALGGSTSIIKDVSARLVAIGQVASGLFVSDEVVKGAMSLYVFSNMEVASYTILVEAAGHVGDAQTQQVCMQILNQKVAKAQWLLEYLPQVTHVFLSRSETESAAAKR